MQSFLIYVLGLPSPSGKRAEIGTIVHKVLECLANGKIAHQNGVAGSISDDICGEILTDPQLWYEEEYIRRLVEASYHYYQSKSVHEWYPKERRECDSITMKALEQGCGMFDPRKRSIVAAEPFFDISLPYEWAHYKWELPDGTVLEGQLGLKGTVDLVLDGGGDENNRLYEVNDWKTGQRKDWATGEEKTYDKLDVDAQLSIYHLALAEKYPEVKNWAMTMNYITAGGPFTCAYTEADKIRTLEMLRKQFERIKKCIHPVLRKGKERWFCNRVCHFGKNDHPESKCGDSICWHTHQKIRNLGMSQTIKEEINPDFCIGSYQAPGE